ncbi:MAG: DNA alkylation repair protein [Calditrichota bacterium]
MPDSDSALADQPQLEQWAEVYLNHRLSAEEFLERIDRLLADRDLFPPEAIFQLGSTLGTRLENSPGPAVDLTLKLMSSDVRATRAIAVGVLHRLARFQPGFWTDAARHLITDSDWEVRDIAARVFDDWNGEDGAAEFHLSFVVDVVRDWVQDSDERVRRAASQALLGYAARHPEFRSQLLEILDPLLTDEREYVRHSLAAALRILGRSDPPFVMDYLELVAASNHEPAKEIVKLVLDHSFADRLPDRKAELLRRL